MLPECAFEHLEAVNKISSVWEEGNMQIKREEEDENKSAKVIQSLFQCFCFFFLLLK